MSIGLVYFSILIPASLAAVLTPLDVLPKCHLQCPDPGWLVPQPRGRWHALPRFLTQAPQGSSAVPEGMADHPQHNIDLDSDGGDVRIGLQDGLDLLGSQPRNLDPEVVLPLPDVLVDLIPIDPPTQSLGHDLTRPHLVPAVSQLLLVQLLAQVEFFQQDDGVAQDRVHGAEQSG